MARKNSKVAGVVLAGSALVSAAAEAGAPLSGAALERANATQVVAAATYSRKPAKVVAAPVAPVAAPAAPVSASATAKNAGLVVAKLASGPLSVAALAESLGITSVAVRNAIDNVRRVKGKGAVVSLGSTVFGLPV